MQPASTKIGKQLSDSGYSTDYAWQVRRNSDGTRVYLYAGPDSRELGILVVEKGRIVRQITRPAQLAYLDDQGQFVAWSDDLRRGVTFRNGTHLEINLASLDVDPDGRYFVTTSGQKPSSKIAAVDDPTHVLVTSQLFAYRIFASARKIYLIGTDPDGQNTLACETYSLTGHQVNLLSRRTVGSELAVLDMDPATERLLVRERFRLLNSTILIGLAGNDETRLRVNSDDTLFLQPGVMLGSS